MSDIKITAYVTGFVDLPRAAYLYITISDCINYRLFRVLNYDDEVVDCWGVEKW